MAAKPVDAPIAAREEAGLDLGLDLGLDFGSYYDFRQSALLFAQINAGLSPTALQVSVMYDLYHSYSGLSIFRPDWIDWHWPEGEYPQDIPTPCPPWGFWPWFFYFCHTYYPSYIHIWVDWYDRYDCLLGILCL